MPRRPRPPRDPATFVPFAHGLLEEQIHEIVIEKVVYGGYGFGRINGVAAFVPYTAAGDRAKVELTRVKRGHVFGELRELFTASPQRTNYDCPYFQRCGGCNFGHIAYEHQLEIKRRIVGEELAVEAPPLTSASALGYRNKASFHVDERGELGFYSRMSTDLIPIAACAITDTRINAALPAIRQSLLQLRSLRCTEVVAKVPPEGNVVYVTLFSPEPSPDLDAVRAVSADLERSGVLLAVNYVRKAHRFGEPLFNNHGEGFTFSMAARRFSVDSASFFQVNYEIAGKLLAALDSVLSRHELGDMLELYSGMGALSVVASKHARNVYAVEMVRPATLLSERIMAENGITNVEHRTGEGWRITKKLIKEGRRFDTLLLDPPRRGIEPGVMEDLPHFGFKKIFYVSCSIPTLKRDIATFKQQGFRLTHAEAFDMFPQTYHFENLVVLERD